MTTTEQLTRWMRHDPTFVGVFPLDKIPSLHGKSHSFIVNTQTHNLPGQHWIAVRTVFDRAWIFDPLSSHPPPPSLCHHLSLYCNIYKLYVCRMSVQPPSSNTCGPHCVYFLYTGLPASSEYDVLEFINKLDK